ncbi:hypothetical protein HDV00_003636 [Rhizophlyctis rosea]|nr:hypothetical protein HDV00_003636 [Rhizophlyctis rosea]
MSSPLQNIFAHSTKFYKTADGKHTVSYEDSDAPGVPSQRPVAILLPGMGDFRHQFRFIGPKFVNELGYRVIAADLRGAGPEVKDTATDGIGFLECVSDTIGVLDQEKITTPVVIIANSYCAAVALHIAVAYPARVKAIVSYAGFFRPGSGAAATIMNLVMPMIINTYWHTAWISYFRSLFISPPPPGRGAYIKAMNQIYTADRHKATYLTALAKSSPQSVPTAWSKIGECKTPVLVLVGEKDPDWADAAEEGREVKDALKGSALAECEVVEGVGHYPHVELPERVFEVTKGFLGRAGVL